MRFRLLACDYDRTIALKGVLVDPARRALEEVRSSGRRLVLVTGRTMNELCDVFDDFDLFTLVVVENGAVLYDPATQDQRPLVEPVPVGLVEELRRREVAPLVVGLVVCATASENEPLVMRAINDLGVDLKIALNRDSIMVMPPGVDKAFGLRAALDELGESAPHVVAVGDGENDLALLSVAGVAVAVENAVDELKAQADIVLTASGTEGVRQLCTSLVRHDLADLLDPTEARRAG